MSKIIVWDLETVPDLKGFAAANALTGKWCSHPFSRRP
jgi:hypothetical protein